MDFVRSNFGKMTNMLKKVFNWSEVHLSEVTSYKIHTLEEREFQFVYLCSLLSNTLFIRRQNGSKLQSFFMYDFLQIKSECKPYMANIISICKKIPFLFTV